MFEAHAGTASEPLDDLDACLARAAVGHAQLCPRQVLAVRIGRHAGQLLGLQLPRQDKRLLAFVETDGCAVDGVTAATGCAVGRRTLRVLDFGKVAATFVDLETRQAVRIWPRPEARALARACVPDAPDIWHAMLEGYRRLPVDDLLGWQPVTIVCSLDAILSQPGLRVTCARCREEIMNEREVQVGGASRAVIPRPSS